MLTKKLIHEWKTNEDDFWRNKLVILLQCRAIKEKYITFKKMLRSCVGFSFEQFSDIYEFIMLNPERTVLMVDGLDELSLDNEDIQTDDSGSPNEKRHVITHLSMLVEGKLLPDVTVLITSRPTAERKFRDMEFARTVEIMGFFENEIKEFVEKFCHEDRNIADRILNKIEISLELRSFCYIPINTKIVCMTLKECFADDENYSPKTMTELYDRAIKVLLWQSHPLLRGKTTEKDYLRIPLPSELDKDLQEIKYVAMEGLKDGRLIFERKSNSNFKNLENCGIFNKIYDDERHLYCFLHLTLQEFFAAWYIVDDWQNIGKFLDDHVQDPKWHLVIEFAAGLVGNEKKEKGKDISVILERLESWMSHLFFSEGNQALGFLGMKCFYELQDDDEMRSVCESNNLSETISINNVSFTPLDSNAFFEFLSECRQLRKLAFFSCQFPDDHSVIRLSKYLTNATACNVFSLKIISCSVKNISKHLREALKSENCKLSELEIRKNNIGEEGAKYLSEALKSENSKLTKLIIIGNNMGDKCAKYFSEALTSENCKLTELSLSRNELAAGGAKYLSEALKSETCKLTKLSLDYNNIGEEGAKSLSEALNCKNCKLTKLIINGNKIDDKGAKYFSEALKTENCKLAELSLEDNSIAAEGAKYLSEALKSKNCKLSELDIRFNKLKDQSANLLIQAMKYENCKLTKLKICGNNISKQSAEAFTEALKSQNCKLTQLDVHFHTITNENTECLSKTLKSENCKYAELYLFKTILTDEEAKCFSKALKSEYCKLIKLDIIHTKITAEGAKYLSEALKSENCKLTKLSLTLNNIGDEGAKSLSEALKSENCKLTELDLSYNHIGYEGAKSLSEALKSENCKLTELGLSYNNIGYEGAKSLSEALKSVNCKLTELGISDNDIGYEGAKSLSEALKSENCKLTELDLSHNSIGDEGAKSLSEALKSENCKLTELGLSSNKIGDEGAKSLSNALKSENCKLTELSLFHK
ncbi:protein NLRC3-like [Xenia sp. Carnegie-2017]|uniref:protein NLRC3-like n=1 Tax=Xenia sp. Carnegie-2017 TaxID=2897299 RepID=UPI001F0420AE|nr:protein NLRC3-like [Xenia sp. Carnegie-2017]